MKNYYTDKTCLNIIRLIVLILTFAIIIAAYYYLSFIPIFMWIIIVVFSITGFFISSIYLPIYFRNAVYCISDKEIIKYSGFFIKTKQVMKREAVQFTNSLTMPFSKVTGFNGLIINAFGGTIMLFFLKRKDIDEIAAVLNQPAEYEGEEI